MKYRITYSTLFTKWHRKLPDLLAQQRIATRLRRIEHDGNFGDHKALGGGLYELREHYGAGYRLYYTQRGGEIIILLIGGDKSSQARDIEKARILMKEY